MHFALSNASLLLLLLLWKHILISAEKVKKKNVCEHGEMTGSAIS